MCQATSLQVGGDPACVRRFRVIWLDPSGVRRNPFGRDADCQGRRIRRSTKFERAMPTRIAKGADEFRAPAKESRRGCKGSNPANCFERVSGSTRWPSRQPRAHTSFGKGSDSGLVPYRWELHVRKPGLSLDRSDSGVWGTEIIISSWHIARNLGFVRIYEGLLCR
jgi:hypothetical protein